MQEDDDDPDDPDDPNDHDDDHKLERTCEEGCGRRERSTRNRGCRTHQPRFSFHKVSFLSFFNHIFIGPRSDHSLPMSVTD